MDYYKGVIPIIESDKPATDLSHPRHAAFGYVPRDYRADPEMMFAPPDQMEVIQQTEWDARFDEQEATKSSLEHIYLSGPNGEPAFINLDQDGDGYCVTADTEVLTEKGWVGYPDYDWASPLATVNPTTHAMEFQRPFEKHVYEYDGDMIYSTNRRIDFGVTPGHQMYVRKWDERRRTLSDKYSFVQAKDLGWYAGLLSSPSGQIGTDLVEVEVPGDRRYDGDDFVALLALGVSDGYAGGAESTKNWVSFASFREGSHAAVAALAARVGFHESPSRKGVWARYDAGALAAWIRENCYENGKTGALSKKVPDIVKCLSQRQIKLFLYWFDDRIRDGRQFFSASKRMIDDLQELHLRIGKRSHIGNVDARTTMLAGKEIRSKEAYTLTVGEIDRLCVDRKKHIEKDHYKGLVYCAAVPNHTLLTRRNGSVLISSNCWSYSTGHAIMLDRLRQHQPLIRINPHATAAIIKGGRNEGGWCGLSAKWARENGYAVEGTGPGQWPKQSRNLKYDTPELRAAMALHKVQEDWCDLTRQVYDQNLTTLQMATCGFNNIPAPSDFNWWSHSVCQVRWVRIERGSWGPLILNSWLGWGRYGLGVLRGSQAICNGGLGIRMSTASAA